MVKQKRQPLGWDRRQEIRQFLRQQGSASTSTIGEHVGASPATIHRDLEYLSDQGLVGRVHGGAVSLELADDPPTTVERHKRIPEKQRIAEVARERVRDSVSSVFLEASTTVAYLAPLLRDMDDKVILTNSPEIALELVNGQADVVLIGGNLRQRTLSTVGPMAIDALGMINIDLAFVGVSAISSDGLSSMNDIEAQTKSALISAAKEVVALGDGDKLGKRALIHVAPLSSLDELITDSNAPQAEIQRLTDAGLKVLVAGS